MLARVECKIADAGGVGGKLFGCGEWREVGEQQVGPAVALAAQGEKIVGLGLIAVRRDEQGDRSSFDIEVRVENIAGHGGRYNGGVTLVVSRRDCGDNTRENLADENLFDGGDVVLRPVVAVAVSSRGGEAATPAIEATARGLPICGERAVDERGIGVDQLFAVDGHRRGEIGEFVSVHGQREEPGVGGQDSGRAARRPTVGARGDLGSNDRRRAHRRRRCRRLRQGSCRDAERGQISGHLRRQAFVGKEAAPNGGRRGSRRGTRPEVVFCQRGGASRGAA